MLKPTLHRDPFLASPVICLLLPGYAWGWSHESGDDRLQHWHFCFCSMTLIMAFKTLVALVCLFSFHFLQFYKAIKKQTAMVSQTTILRPLEWPLWNGLSSLPRWAVNTSCESNSDGPILGSLSWQGPAYMQAFTAVCPKDAESLGPSAWLWALHSWHGPFHVCWKNAQLFISIWDE